VTTVLSELLIMANRGHQARICPRFAMINNALPEAAGGGRVGL
jgi:hypothetical protein